MSDSPPNSKWARREEWLKKKWDELAETSLAEKIGLVLIGLLLGVVGAFNAEAWVIYRVGAGTWAIIFDADMTAGLVVLALFAVVFDFWKLRRKPTGAPTVIELHLTERNGHTSTIRIEGTEKPDKEK